MAGRGWVRELHGQNYGQNYGAAGLPIHTAAHILPIHTAARRGTNSGGSVAGSGGGVARTSMPSGKVTLTSAMGSTKGAHTSSWEYSL